MSARQSMKQQSRWQFIFFVVDFFIDCLVENVAAFAVTLENDLLKDKERVNICGNLIDLN
jgi:hypothetical protein